MDRPFNTAFIGWLAEAECRDLLHARACEDRDAVEIQFSHAAGALEGYADAKGLSVSAVLHNEGWDILLYEDLAADFDCAGWFCSLCPPSGRRHFQFLETLWEDHLFRRLGDWIEADFRPSAGIEFFGGGGVTWAKLAAAPTGSGQFHRFRIEPTPERR